MSYCQLKFRTIEKLTFTKDNLPHFADFIFSFAAIRTKELKITRPFFDTITGGGVRVGGVLSNIFNLAITMVVSRKLP